MENIYRIRVASRVGPGWGDAGWATHSVYLTGTEAVENPRAAIFGAVGDGVCEIRILTGAMEKAPIALEDIPGYAAMSPAVRALFEAM